MYWISPSWETVEPQFNPTSTWLQNSWPFHEPRLFPVRLNDRKRGGRRPTHFFLKPAGAYERKSNLFPPPLSPPAVNIAYAVLKHYFWEEKTDEMFLTKHMSELFQDCESTNAPRRAHGEGGCGARFGNGGGGTGIGKRQGWNDGPLPHFSPV